MQHASHLAQRRDRVGQVLEHLVRMHDVECVVGEVERVEVGGAELDVARGPVVALGVGRFDRGGRRVDADHVPGVRPGSAKSSVMVPGPQPTSRIVVPGARCGMR